MRNHAFHQYHSGKTTLSASGMFLPDTLYNTEVAKRFWDTDDGRNSMLVMTVASVIEPFLTIQHRENLLSLPELIPGAEIDIMVEVDVPTSSLALQSLVQASSGSQENGWEFGWSLVSTHQPEMNGTQTQAKTIRSVSSFSGYIEYDHNFLMEREKQVMGKYSNPSQMARSTTRIAILGVGFHLNDLPKIGISPLNKMGEFILAIGSPFGILSPVHFFNSHLNQHVSGSVANCYPPKSTDRALLMADSMSTCWYVDRPLRQRTVMLRDSVIPWEAIASSCGDLLLKEPQIAEKGIHINSGSLNNVGNGLLSKSNGSNGLCCYNHDHLNSPCPSLLIEKAMTSICLITIDDGVWASGVVLNDQGLILTNAHLLEPWRFGKTIVRSGSNNEAPFLLPEGSASPEGGVFDRYQKSSLVPFPLADDQKGYKVNSLFLGHRRIRVRLDHLDPWIWCNAKVVYICKGPLDVALLQLDNIPDKLSPIMVDFNQPSVGSKAYVIGHGLLAPRCGKAVVHLSICLWLLSFCLLRSGFKSSQSRDALILQIFYQGFQYPAMLETTAAVHPGGSGGSVVNSDGRLIGLVTSQKCASAYSCDLVAFVVVAIWMEYIIDAHVNARHGGGKVIPHLNFSITSAVLMPIFQFARVMKDFSPLQHLDQPNEHLSSVWTLMPPLSPKPGPRLDLPQLPVEGNDSKEGKGSRFAKFIAERNELLKGTSQLGKPERLPNQILPITQVVLNQQDLCCSRSQRSDRDWTNLECPFYFQTKVGFLQPMGEPSTKSSGYKEYVAGLLAGVATVVVGHPFDTVKVQLQKHNTEVECIKYRNGLHCTARILSTEGVKGLYKGATSSFIGVAFESSLVFVIIRRRKSFAGIRSSEPQPRVIIPSAAFGGAIISLFYVHRSWMQVQGTDSLVPKSNSYPSPLHCALKTIKSDGVRKYLLFKDLMHRWFKLTEAFQFWSAVLPLDVAKTIIQTSPDKSAPTNPFQVLNSGSIMRFCKARNDIDTLRLTDLQEGRNRECYAGLGPTIVRALPANAAAIVTWELAMKLLGIKNDQGSQSFICFQQF
ncbi:Protease-related, putative isoform 2 [Hibiscus syriacus]|uniref:Protease-related, putative isoform 2 n=1 Tax=Hibiscus syriacus TaxID=106335 RepID=A0A6A2ZET5_HIBSY|nr:Protease-related, putative isoform 2 [Hibiscus syriacus]